MQIWWLLISINLILSSKEINPITRKSVSKLVMQPSFRAVNRTEWQTFEKLENKRQMYGSRAWVDWLPYICLLFSFFFNVYHFACVCCTALKLGCITNFEVLFLVMGLISLVDEIQFMLIIATIFIWGLYFNTRSTLLFNLKLNLWLCFQSDFPSHFTLSAPTRPRCISQRRARPHGPRGTFVSSVVHPPNAWFVLILLLLLSFSPDRSLHLPRDLHWLHRSQSRLGEPAVPAGLRQLSTDILISHVRQNHWNAASLHPG